MNTIRNRHTTFQKKFESFLKFESWIKTKKKAVYFHPDYVMMTWETYRSMIKQAHEEKRPTVILDEFADFPKEWPNWIDEKKKEPTNAQEWMDTFVNGKWPKK